MVIGNGSCNSLALSKVGFNEIRRSVVTSCRAVLLPRFGGPEVLELRDNESVPDLKPNEVLVRARAVSVNPLDCRVSFPFFSCVVVILILNFELLA